MGRPLKTISGYLQLTGTAGCIDGPDALSPSGNLFDKWSPRLGGRSPLQLHVSTRHVSARLAATRNQMALMDPSEYLRGPSDGPKKCAASQTTRKRSRLILSGDQKSLPLADFGRVANRWW